MATRYEDDEDEFEQRLRSGDAGDQNIDKMDRIARVIGDDAVDQITERNSRRLKENERIANSEERDILSAFDRDNRLKRSSASSQAIAFFTDANGVVRPITAPNGEQLRKASGGLLYGTTSGKPYRQAPDGSVYDAERDSTEVRKDGHVYDVAKGLPWKWKGLDEVEMAEKADATIAKSVKEKTTALRDVATSTAAVASGLRADIASDMSELRTLESEQKAVESEAPSDSGNEHSPLSIDGLLEMGKQMIPGSSRPDLSGKITKLKAQIALKRATLATAELDARKAAVASKEWATEKLALVGANSAKLPDKSSSSGVNAMIPGTDIPKPLPASERLPQADVSEMINASIKARSTVDFRTAANQALEKLNEDIATGSGSRIKVDLPQQAFEPIPATGELKEKYGVDTIPPQWQTEEALARQAAARASGQAKLDLPEGYRIENGAIYVDERSPKTFLGISYGTSTNSKRVGHVEFDQYGVPLLRIDRNHVGYSPSFQSGDYYRGMPELLTPSEDFIVSFAHNKTSQVDNPTGQNVSPEFVADVAGLMDSALEDPELAEAWDSRRWGPEQVSSTLDVWETLNDTERAEVIGQLDPRQRTLDPQSRKLDTQWLMNQGYLSRQDARLINKTIYGTEPVAKPITDSYADWIKTSSDPRAIALREMKPDGFWDGLKRGGAMMTGVGSIWAIDDLRRSAADRVAIAEAANAAFMAEYYQTNGGLPDFDNRGFNHFRDNVIGGNIAVNDKVSNWTIGAVENAVGSTVGIGVGILRQGAALIGGQGQASNPVDLRATDEEVNLVADQSIQSVKQMGIALADRMTFNPRDLWSGKQGGTIKRASEELFAQVDAGTLSEVDVRKYGQQITEALAKRYGNAQLAAGSNILDPKTDAFRYLAAYVQTRDKTYRTLFEQSLHLSPEDKELQEKVANFATGGGMLSESQFVGPFLTGITGGSIAPVTEMGIEIASDLVSLGTAKVLTGGIKWTTKGVRAAGAVQLADRITDLSGSFAKRLEEFGTIKRPAGTELSDWAKSWNGGVTLLKQGAVTATGEAAEEFIAAFGTPGADVGDALSQALTGFVGGFGMSPMFLGVSKVGDAIARAKVEGAANKLTDGFVNWWNGKFADTPITREQVVTARGYHDLALNEQIQKDIALLYKERTALVAEQSREDRAPKTFEADFTYTPKGGAAPVTVPLQVKAANANDAAVALNARAHELDQYNSDGKIELSPARVIGADQSLARLDARATRIKEIDNKIGGLSMDIHGISERGINTAWEVEGIADLEQREIVTAAIKALQGRELTPAQERALMGPASIDDVPIVDATMAPDPNTPVVQPVPEAMAYQVKSGQWVVTDKALARLKEIAPIAYRSYMQRSESEQRARWGAQEATIEGQGAPKAGKGKATASVASQTNVPVPAGQTADTTGTPTGQAPAPLQPLPAVTGQTFEAEATYRPRGQTSAVTVPIRVQAADENAAAPLIKQRAKAFEKVADGPIAIGPVTLSNVQETQPVGGDSDEQGQLQTQGQGRQEEVVAAGAPGDNWSSEGIRAAVTGAATIFGQKVIDSGIWLGHVDAWGKHQNFGLHLIDRLNPGSELGQWIDKISNAPEAAQQAIAAGMSAPWAHRVWFGHDFAVNLPRVIDQFGVGAIPEFIGQLLKDATSKAGIPLPGVELLVHSGIVKDTTAVAWLSANLMDVFSGGLSFLGTYRLQKIAKRGTFNRSRTIFAVVGIGFKLIGGVMTSNPFIILSGLADTAILVTNFGQLKAAFAKIESRAGTAEGRIRQTISVPGPVKQPPVPQPASVEPAQPMDEEGARAIFAKIAQAGAVRRNLQFFRAAIEESSEPMGAGLVANYSEAAGFKIYVNFAELAQDLNNYAPKDRAARLSMTLDEEISHLGQYEAVRRMWETAGKPGTYEGFFQGFYQDIWNNEFTREQREVFTRLYNPKFKPGDTVEAWASGAEAVRMLLQAKRYGEVSESFFPKTQKLSDSFREFLNTLLNVFKEMLRTGIQSAHVMQTVARLEELLAEATQERAPPTKPVPTGTKSVQPTVKDSLTPGAIDDLAKLPEERRNAVLSAPGIQTGETGVYEMADGTQVPFHYEIIDSRRVVEAPDNQRPNSEHIDTKTFVAKASGAAFRPQRLLNPDETFINGPPLVELRPDGRFEIKGGHRRFYLYRANRPAYYDTIRKAAPGDQAKLLIDRMPHAFKVAVIDQDISSWPPDRRQALIRDLNNPRQQATNRAFEAVSAAKLIDDKIAEIVGSVFEGTEGSALQVLENAKPALARALQNAGILNDTNMGLFMGTDGKLTNEGAKFVRSVLVGRILDNPVLMERLQDSNLERKLVSGLPALLKMEAAGQNMEVFRAAVGYEARRMQEGYPTALEWQASLANVLFADIMGELDPRSAAIQRWIDSFAPNQARSKFKALLDAAYPGGRQRTLDSKSTDIGELLLNNALAPAPGPAAAAGAAEVAQDPSVRFAQHLDKVGVFTVETDSLDAKNDPRMVEELAKAFPSGVPDQFKDATWRSLAKAKLISMSIDQENPFVWSIKSRSQADHRQTAGERMVALHARGLLLRAAGLPPGLISGLRGLDLVGAVMNMLPGRQVKTPAASPSVPPWSTAKLAGVPDAEVIAWAKTHPEFAQRRASMDGTEAEIARGLARDKAFDAPTSISLSASSIKDTLTRTFEFWDMMDLPLFDQDLFTPEDIAGEKINRGWTAFSSASGTMGIPREDMPQIKSIHRGALTQFLTSRGITHEEQSVLPGQLKPSQREFSPAKVDKARKFKGGNRAILVSQDGFVMDGHHQWMAKLSDEPTEPMRVIRFNAPAAVLIDKIKEFPSVETTGGNPEALFKEHIAYAKELAAQFKNIPGLTVSELNQEAIIALDKAANRFRAGRNVSFETYAGRVIKNRLRDVWTARTRRIAHEGPSLNQEIDEEGRTLADIIAGADVVPAVDQESKKIVDGLLAVLDEEEKFVMEHFMAGASLSEIGDMIGVNKQKAGRIRDNGLAKLRAQVGIQGITKEDVGLAAAGLKPPSTVEELDAWRADMVKAAPHNGPIFEAMAKMGDVQQLTLAQVLKMEAAPADPANSAKAAQIKREFEQKIAPLKEENRAIWNAYRAEFTDQVREWFDVRVENAAKKTNSVAMARVPLKGERGLEKAIQDADEKNISIPDAIVSLKDVVRASIITTNDGEMESVLSLLNDAFEIVAHKDRFKNPQTGYKDHLLNVRLPNGRIAEIQVHRVDMIFAKSVAVGHKLYEKWREAYAAKDKATQEAVGKESELLYGTAEAIFNRFITSSSDMGPALAAGNAIRASLGLSLPSTSNIALPSTPGITAETTPDSTSSENNVPSGNFSGITNGSLTPVLTSPARNRPVEISPANIDRYRGEVDVSELVARKGRYLEAFKLTPDAVIMPLANLISLKNELLDPKFLAGKKNDPRQTAGNAMVWAIDNDPRARKKRDPLDVLDNEDGTYTIDDGNATAQAAMLAGWDSIPVRIKRGVSLAASTVSESDAQLAAEFVGATGAKPADVATRGIARTLSLFSDPQLELEYGTPEQGTPALTPKVPRAPKVNPAQVGVALRLHDPEAIRAAMDKKGRVSSIISRLVSREIPGFNINGAVINSAADFAMLAQTVRSPYFESLKVAWLDSKMTVVHSQILHVGSLNEAVVGLRDMLQSWREAKAKSPGVRRLIVSHNHPSGDPSPSGADLRVQQRIESIFTELGVHVIDHVITNGKEFYSMRDSSKLPLDAPLAKWEVVARDKLFEFSSSREGPEQYKRGVNVLRQANPDSAHIIYLTTKNAITAVERVNPETSGQLLESIMDGAAREGAKAVLVDFPPRLEATEANGWYHRIGRFLKEADIAMHDASWKGVDSAALNGISLASATLRPDQLDFFRSPVKADLFGAEETAKAAKVKALRSTAPGSKQEKAVAANLTKGDTFDFFNTIEAVRKPVKRQRQLLQQNQPDLFGPETYGTEDEDTATSRDSGAPAMGDVPPGVAIDGPGGRSRGMAQVPEGGASGAPGLQGPDVSRDVEQPAGDRDQIEGDRGTGDAPVSGRGGSAGNAVPDVGRVGAARRKPRGAVKRTLQSVERPTDPNERNYIIPAGDIAPRGTMSKLKANLRALEIIKALDAENRLATPQEKSELVKFSGWGALSQAFDDDKAQSIKYGEIESNERLARQYDSPAYNSDYYRPLAEQYRQKAAELRSWQEKWSDAHEKIKSILTSDEYWDAKKSTINAHYTSPEIIRPMWRMAKQMGFKGGNVLEPGAGIGHFFGLMPAEFAETAKLFGIELDTITAKILKALYPEADIQNSPFQTADVADNSIDLAISNVPFANVAVTDPAIKEMGGPVGNLHDYFFGKTLTKLRQGGIAVFITSAFTMDKANQEGRRWLAERADLVAAYRLPNDAFKANAGTDVVTDIIILRKKDGTPFAHGKEWLGLADATMANGGTIKVNEYFANHPQNILGRLANDGSMRAGREEMTVHSDPNIDVQLQLQYRADELPADILGENVEGSVRVNAEVSTVKMGSIEEVDGGFRFNGVDELDAELNADPEKTRSFLRVRDALNRQYDLELDETAEESAIEENRKALNKAYDAHVKAHGNFHGLKNKLFQDDPDFFRLAGAEVAEKAKVNPGEDLAKAMRRKPTYRKADVFSKRVLEPRSEPTTAKSIEDAFGISLGWRGRVDLSFMASLLDKSIEQVERSLIDGEIAVREPSTGKILSREQYLSGNVRKKLAIARASGSQYERNVRMLESVQPPDLTLDDIRFKIGATWIPARYYQDFIKEMGVEGVEVSYSASPTAMNVDDGPRGGLESIKDKFKLETKKKWFPGVGYKDFEVPGMSFLDMMETLLNMGRVQISDRVDRGEGKVSYIVNEAKTEAAKAAAAKLHARFQSWTRANPTVAAELAHIYNHEVNAHAQRDYDGQFLTLPWAAKDFDIFPDKKNVIWRAIQDGFGLVAHGVGGGKTILGTSIALEWRRLGMARKPMIVVHNATLEQFADTIAKIAPTARVLVGRKDELQGKKRKEFLMRIASGDWDAVVVAHSTFGLIADDPEVSKKHQQALIDELVASLHASGVTLAEARSNKKDKSVKETVKQIEKLESMIKENAERKTDTDVLNFQQLGIDALIVDEVHKFKKLPFSTKLDVKGIDKTMSKRGYAMLMRARGIQEKMGGKNVATMTGTPVTNTLGEIWNMVRLVAPHLLREYQVESFDQFVSKFAEVETTSEETPSGDRKMVERLAKIVNLPEWSTFFRLAADVKFGDDMVVKNRPGIKGGKPELVSVDRTPGVTKWVAYIRDVLNEFGAMDPKELFTDPKLFAVPVQSYMSSRAAAIDIRLIEPRAKDEPGSKVNEMLDRAMALYKQTGEYKGTQAIFADSYRNVKVSLFDALVPNSRIGIPIDENSTASEFNLYQDIQEKLIKRGVPASEIAIVSDKKYSNPKAREQLFDSVNRGEVRFILGSTEKLGTGVNMQRLMIAGHNLDVPWTPADLEQRDGRIFRQGNVHGEMGEEIELLRYGMRDSLDSALWQKLETKQRFITLALSGRVIGREIEEVDEVLNLAEQRAILSGKFGQELFELDNKIRGLNLARDGHQAVISRREEDIRYGKRQLESLAQEAAKREVELAPARRLAQVVKDSEITLRVNGEEFKTKTALTEAIDAEMAKLGTRVNSITVNGMPVELIRNDETAAYHLFTSGSSIPLGRVSGRATLVSRLEELPELLENLDRVHSATTAKYQQLASLPPVAAWDGEAELKKAQDRIAEIQEIQNKEAEAAKAETEGVKPESVSLAAAGTPSNTPQFYSQLTRLIESKIQGKSATPEQVRAIIKNAKPEEVKWTGVELAIDRIASENGGKVSKQALVDYLNEEGSVRIEEVVSGDRYAKYQLPGGSNYREVVLAMPEMDSNYRSTHFPDIPNYVAHMRTNERADSEGAPGLFIEEIQSDRHQQGRNKGYRNEISPEEARKRLGIHISDWNALTPEQQQLETLRLTPDAPFRKEWPLQMFKRALRDAIAGSKQWIGWTSGETQADRYDLSKQVDKVVLTTTGELRAFRKGEEVITRQVTEDELPDLIGKEAARKLLASPVISAPENSTEGWHAVKDPNSPMFWTVYDQNGEYIMGAAAEDEADAIRQGLELLNGVQVSRSSEPHRKLEGEELKIGGEGMKGFYDNILPKEIGKYVKQWGAKVEKGRLTSKLPRGVSIVPVSLVPPLQSEKLPSDAKFAALDEDGYLYMDSDGYSIIGATADEVRKLLAEDSESIVNDKDFWKIAITPEMSESIQKAGLALFAAATPADIAARELSSIQKEATGSRENSEAAKVKPVVAPGTMKEFLNTHLAGRLDKLEYFAPGIKAILATNTRNESLVSATINTMLDGIRQDLKKAFGGEAWWRKATNTTRMKRFIDTLLPTAARLEVDAAADGTAKTDANGNFVFRDFKMRVGLMPMEQARIFGITTGDTYMYSRAKNDPNAVPDFVELGPVVKDKDGNDAYLLLRPMPAAAQQIIYDQFHADFPEAAHYLDQWIMPGMEESRYQGVMGVNTATFNRTSLRSLFNEWPTELRDLFSESPIPDMPYVEGYTPDVKAQKSIIGAIGSILFPYWSGGRDMKSGQARESGNVRNLFEGFSIRAQEAHREKIYRETRSRLIEAAARPSSSIPADQVDKYIPISSTFSDLLKAMKIAKGLDPKKYPELTDALNPANKGEMIRLMGDAYKLRGRDLMIHRQVARELILSLAVEKNENILLRVLDGLLRRLNAGYLALPLSAWNNWWSNEMLKTMRAGNRLLYGLMSGLTGDMTQAKVGLYEAGYLLRGFITDRFPKWQQNRIGSLVPRELFADSSMLHDIDLDPTKGIVDELKSLNVGAALMKLWGYGEIDISQKQQMAYAGYMAHAAVAWDAAKRANPGLESSGVKRKEWMRDWIRNASPDVHNDVRQTALAYLMDYSNVPYWLDAAQHDSLLRKVMVRGFLPFAKWPYNMFRQTKRFTWDSAKQILPGHTKAERINGLTNLMLMGGLAGLGAAVFAAGDDDDEEKILGSNLDEEGRVLDAQFRTGNRLNLSRIARILLAHGAMRDVEFNVNDENGNEQDLWLRYRSYPWFREAMLLGAFANGNTKDGLRMMGETWEEYMSVGIFANMMFPGINPNNKSKSTAFIETENLMDLTTAGVVPPPIRRLATTLIDPVARRTKESKTLGYEAGVLDAVKANTPFLSRSVPAAGEVKSAPLVRFDSARWLKNKIKDAANLPPEQRAEAIDKAKSTYERVNNPTQQATIFKWAGVNPAQLKKDKTTVANVAADLTLLKERGIGPESIHVFEKTDDKGNTQPMIAYPDPTKVATTPRTVQLTRALGGLNMKPSPRQVRYQGPKSQKSKGTIVTK